jgi:phosphatidylglycerophosphatase A
VKNFLPGETDLTTFKVKPDWALLRRQPAMFIAFGFGSGLSPRAPGTIGTLAAYPLFWLLGLLGVSGWWLALLCLPLFWLGVVVCDRADEVLGVHDYGGTTIDEVVAMLLVLAFTPSGWLAWCLAFVLFRLFDILKPWPIRWLDQNVHGGLGVMVDDIAAALPCIAILLVLHFTHYI